MLPIEIRLSGNQTKGTYSNIIVGLNIQKLNIIIPNPETKELKRRVRDIIEPGRNLGHVDGKKRIVPVTDTHLMRLGEIEGNEEQEAYQDKNLIPAAEEERDVRKPAAIRSLQTQVPESERRLTAVDVGGMGMNNERWKAEANRDPKSSVCEDCNRI